MQENKGNPYHDKEGKFTSKNGEGQGQGKKNPFEGSELPGAKEMSPLWDNLMEKAQKIIDSRKGEQPKETEKRQNLSDQQLIKNEVDDYMNFVQRYGLHETDEELAEEIIASLKEKKSYFGEEHWKKEVLGAIKAHDSRLEDYEHYDDVVTFDDYVTPLGEYEEMIPVDGDMMVDFLKACNVKLTDKQKEYIKNYNEIPRGLNPYNDDKTLQEEFYDWVLNGGDSGFSEYDYFRRGE